jgi:hypothetical protein
VLCTRELKTNQTSGKKKKKKKATQRFLQSAESGN